MKEESGPPAMPDQPEPPWHSRINVMSVTLVAFLAAVAFSLPGIHGSGRDIDYLGNLLRFLSRFFPPDLSVLPMTLSNLLETVRIAVVATAAAILISIPLAVAGARNISPFWLVVTTRMLLNGVRTVPSLIWALFAVAIVGANPMAGVIALTFYSIAYLGKFFADAFESLDSEVAQGMRAIGAGALQAVQFGFWPTAKPLVWSHSLWMLEYNIRSAAIIGIVGAGGIGVQLYGYADSRSWDKFATVLICILVVVTVLDFTGEAIRRRITRKVTKPIAAE